MRFRKRSNSASGSSDSDSSLDSSQPVCSSSLPSDHRGFTLAYRRIVNHNSGLRKAATKRRMETNSWHNGSQSVPHLVDNDCGKGSVIWSTRDMTGLSVSQGNVNICSKINNTNIDSFTKFPNCDRNSGDLNANTEATDTLSSLAPVFFIGDSITQLDNEFEGGDVSHSYRDANSGIKNCTYTCRVTDNAKETKDTECPNGQLSSMSTCSSTSSDTESDYSTQSESTTSNSIDSISEVIRVHEEKSSAPFSGAPSLHIEESLSNEHLQNGTLVGDSKNYEVTKKKPASMLTLRRSSSCLIPKKSAMRVLEPPTSSVMPSEQLSLRRASSCHALATLSLGVRLETVYGLCLPWLPFKWLREPECFIQDQPGVKVKNRIHKHADSLFSTSSGFSDFRGFFNLAVLLLVLSSARVALENIIKYGILVNPAPLLPLFLTNPYSIPSLSLVIFSNVFIFVAFILERLLAAKWLSDGFGSVLLWLNLTVQLGFPCYVILALHPNPVFSSVALLVNTIIFLKLISYKQTLAWCRHDSEKQQPLSRNRYKSVSIAKDKSMEDHFENGNVNTLKKYPENVTLKDLYYFMLAPTLCYELSFPRSSRLRKRFLIKRLAEVAFISGLILALIQQWVLPLIQNALVPFNQMYLPVMLERILKLALPNFCIWLLWFYSTFHSLFNVLAELLMFADRVFYHDWWNSETVAEFWQKWNIPVHRWAIRHVYKPMLTSGYTKLQALLTVFVLSAAFHEILVSIPLGIFRLYAFMGMVLQVPLAILTQRLHPVSPKLCNVIVWCSLIIGQPIAVLMYYVDYYITTQTEM